MKVSYNLGLLHYSENILSKYLVLFFYVRGSKHIINSRNELKENFI